MKTAQIIRTLKREREKMAKSRDALRELRSEIEDEESRLSDAIESIDYAADRLSELV